jgi:hypothetical protein
MIEMQRAADVRIQSGSNSIGCSIKSPIRIFLSMSGLEEYLWQVGNLAIILVSSSIPPSQRETIIQYQRDRSLKHFLLWKCQWRTIRSVALMLRALTMGVPDFWPVHSIYGSILKRAPCFKHAVPSAVLPSTLSLRNYGIHKEPGESLKDAYRFHDSAGSLQCARPPNMCRLPTQGTHTFHRLCDREGGHPVAPDYGELNWAKDSFTHSQPIEPESPAPGTTSR